MPTVCCQLLRGMLLCAWTVVSQAKMSTNSLQQQQRVQYYLPDDTPADYLIGNILSDIHLGNQPMRIMLPTDAWFRLSSEGDLFTQIRLDRDAICGRIGCCDTDICHITYNAYLFDTSPVPTTVQINLFVSDENDNPPVFPRQFQNKTINQYCSWEIFIPESAPIGSRYALPAATDKDSPRFGIQRYKLIVPSEASQSSAFYSNPFSLVVPDKMSVSHISPPAPELQLDQALDRETKEKYDIHIVAIDAGIPALSATLHVCVRVQDVNDNAPEFINQNSAASNIKIPENITLGTVLYQFNATDSDDGPNKEVVYFIDWTSLQTSWNESVLEQISSKFALHSQTGVLRVIKPLDYENEKERRLILTIKATDQGVPKLSASTSLTVSITDVNDNSPEITVLDLSANSKPEDSIKSNILRENDPQTRVLKLISISDADSVSSGKVHCHLTGQQINNFHLSPYSATMYGLVSGRAFDYEEEAKQTGYLTVRLECVDEAEPRRTSQLWIQIALEDVNDNWPQFDRSNYVFHVTEDVQPGHIVGRIYASDADSGPRGTMTYELTADKMEFLEYVKIGLETGIIRTTKKLDREKIDLMEFRVTVRDGGDTEESVGSGLNHTGINIKTNTTSLTIVIEDVNDNAPVYLGPTEVHLVEGVPRGTEVLGNLRFDDYDLGNNGTVRVSLLESTWHGSTVSTNAFPFTIVDNSRLITTGDIDRELQAQILLQLVAVDQGIPKKLSTTVSLSILIDDINDNSPQLIYPKNASLLYGLSTTSEWINTLSTIPVDSPLGSLVVVIHARDLDAGVNGQITYHLMPGDRPSSMGNVLNTITHFTALTQDFPATFTEIADGYDYFQVDELGGQVTTWWGEGTDDKMSTPRMRKNHTESWMPKKEGSTSPPKPGLYALHINLRDCGLPQLRTQAVFYVNLSQATSSPFTLGLFAGAAMSNAVMLVLIMVCSLALIVSLVAAIVWVRFRKEYQSGNAPSGHSHSGYIGPTVICQDNGPNGYYYSTGLPIHEGSSNMQLYDPSFGDYDGTLLQTKDRVTHPNLMDPAVDCAHNNAFPEGLHGGTLIPLCVNPAHLTEYEEKPIYPAISTLNETLTWLPCSPDVDFHIYHPPNSHVTNCSEWLSATNQGDSGWTVHSDAKCNTFGQSDGPPQGQTTNNSTGESDSGVDSGTAAPPTASHTTLSPNHYNPSKNKLYDGGSKSTNSHLVTVHQAYTRSPFATLEMNSRAVITKTAPHIFKGGSDTLPIQVGRMDTRKSNHVCDRVTKVI